MEYDVSPKHSSLALDEIKETSQESEMLSNFEPTLDLIVTTRHIGNASAIVEIGGRVTVSF